MIEVKRFIKERITASNSREILDSIKWGCREIDSPKQRRL